MNGAGVRTPLETQTRKRRRRAAFRRVRGTTLRLYSRRLFARFSGDEAAKIARTIEEQGFDAPVEFLAGDQTWKKTTLGGLLWSLANKVLERGRYDPNLISLNEDWPDSLVGPGKKAVGLHDLPPEAEAGVLSACSPLLPFEVEP